MRLEDALEIAWLLAAKLKGDLGGCEIAAGKKLPGAVD